MQVLLACFRIDSLHSPPSARCQRVDAGTLVYPDLADHVIQPEESLSLDRASVVGSAVTRMDGFGVAV